MTNPSVAIVIPLYKNKVTYLEERSIRQCFEILGKHEIIAVKPINLKLDNYPYAFNQVVSFDEAYFSDLSGYNRLLLSSIFYEKFLAYDFILIYQPDAFVFRDELLAWCNKGYDYVGAPWLRESDYPDLVKKVKNTILNFIHTKLNLKQQNSYLPTALQLENKVGNGGLSLRCTKKFHNICLLEKDLIDYYNTKAEHYFHEDVFWSIEVNRKKKRLSIPGYKVAAKFSMENNCAYAFRLNDEKLPFGCHAWDKNILFWKAKFAENNIAI